MNWFSGIPLVGKIIEKIFPDQNKRIEKKIAEIERDSSIQTEVQKGKNASQYVVLEEARGNFLQRSWRPIMVYMFLIVLFNNVFVVPIAHYYFDTILLNFAFPNDIPDFLTYAITGYMGARTLEKMADKTK